MRRTIVVVLDPEMPDAHVAAVAGGLRMVRGVVDVQIGAERPPADYQARAEVRAELKSRLLRAVEKVFAG